MGNTCNCSMLFALEIIGWFVCLFFSAKHCRMKVFNLHLQTPFQLTGAFQLKFVFAVNSGSRPYPGNTGVQHLSPLLCSQRLVIFRQQKPGAVEKDHTGYTNGAWWHFSAQLSTTHCWYSAERPLVGVSGIKDRKGAWRTGGGVESREEKLAGELWPVQSALDTDLASQQSEQRFKFHVVPPRHIS